MKKFFSLIAAVLFAGSMMAAEVTVAKSIHDLFPDDANGTQEATLYSDAVLTISVNSDGNNGKVYGTGTEWRIYQTNSAVVTVAATDATIKSVAFEFTIKNTAVLNFGDAAMTSGTPVDVNAASAQFVVANSTAATNGQVIIKNFTVVYEVEGGDVPPTPSINYYVAGSMNNWAADAAYMLTPSNNGEYKGEFTFAANDAFKVIGFDGENTTWFPEGVDNNFQITEAGDYKITFNPAGNVEGWYEGFFNVVKKEAPVAISCLEVYQLAKNDVVGLLNPVTVTYSNGANVWVMDGSASMLIYLPSGFTNNFQAGDVLSGVAGTVDIYQNIVYEVKPSADQAAAIVATPGEAPAPSQAAVIEASDVNKYVILPGFSIEGEFTADAKTSLPAALGKDTVTIYNNFKFAYTFEAGKTYNITGVVSAYKGDPQVYFISAEEAGDVPPTPGQTIEVNMSEGLRFFDYVAVEGWWELYGDDGKYIIDLSNVLTEQIAGEYPIDNLDPDYRYLGIINGEDTTYVNFVGGAITLTVSENGDVTVTGTLVGDDDNRYVLNLAYVVPTPQETVNVNIQDGELYDEYAEEDGLYVVYGEDANEVYVQLAILAEEGLQGEFSEADLEVQYIGSFIYDGEEYVEIYSATITVTPGNGGDYNVTATILGYNNKQYNVTMYVPGGEGIEETLAAGKAAKVLRDGQVLILKGEKTFNVMGARIR